MTIFRIILVLGLGWLSYAGLQNIYYGDHLLGGAQLGLGMLLVVLIIGIRLIRDERPQRGYGRWALIGVGLGLVLWLIFFMAPVSQYLRAQAPWLGGVLPSPLSSGRLIFGHPMHAAVMYSDGSLTGLTYMAEGRYTDPRGLEEIYFIPQEDCAWKRASQSCYWTQQEQPFLFVSADEGNQEIYVKKGGDSQPIRLTNNAAADTFPRRSPDGSRTAFVSDRDGGSELYVMQNDGGQQTRLTDDFASVQNPQWSPDGLQIAFVSDRDGADHIYITPAAGGPPLRVTDRALSIPYLQWSPDSRQITFTLDRDNQLECSGCSDIYLANSDGSGQIQLTRTRGSNTYPTWSPDGRQIAFLAKGGSPFSQGLFDIYVMNADGSCQTRLTFTALHSGPLKWVP